MHRYRRDPELRDAIHTGGVQLSELVCDRADRQAGEVARAEEVAQVLRTSIRREQVAPRTGRL